MMFDSYEDIYTCNSWWNLATKWTETTFDEILFGSSTTNPWSKDQHHHLRCLRFLILQHPTKYWSKLW